MANWYGAERTNYFEVKDLERFKAEISRVSGFGVHTRELHGKTSVCLLAETDDGAFPGWIFGEDGEDQEVYLPEIVGPQQLPSDRGKAAPLRRSVAVGTAQD